ncbi:MAG TPA: hypothetical protein PLN43_02800 [Anaerolineales bacterium]|nr:hypothetical protein [Anaerolineales bacterium]
MQKKLTTLIVILGNITVLSGLALLAYLGFYNRYWADDWCYSADARQLGTIPATLQYFDTEDTGYSSNRYSLTFFSALTENTLGMFGNQLVATLTISLWLVGLVWTGWNVSKLIKPLPFAAILFASSLLLFYNLYLSPQRFQILYWRSGVLPYSTAIVFWMLILGFVTSQINRETPARWVNYIVAPLAFIAAGLGEISCVFLFSGTTLFLLAAWYAKKQKQHWAEQSFQTLFIAWLFLLLGMIALIVSPSNARVANMNVKRSSLFSVPFVSLKHAIDFIVFSLKDLPLPHAIFIGIFLGFGIITTKADDSTLTVKRAAVLLAFTTLITYLLITAIQAPSAYFYSATPDPRGQSLSRFTLLFGIAVMAWIAGMWAAQNIKGQWLVLASVVVMLAGYAYTARSIVNIYGERYGFIYRAQIWDERDALIESEKAKGNLLIEVPAIDTGEIHTRDMFGSNGKGWRQFSLNCGARYYGVDGLKVKQ